MSSRGRKRPPYTSGAGKGDRGGLTGGRPPKGPPFEGSYKNKHLVHAITSLIGCVIELKRVDGVVYQGILRTVSPQCDIVLEMACIIEDKVVIKSSLIETLFVSWEDVVVVSAIANNTPKEIFKIDSEISTRSNGVPGTRELQPFEFDSTAGEDNTVQDNLIDGSNWAPEEMFDTNKEKFNVSSTFNPDMPEYTTNLVLQDSEEDKQRLLKAEKKAREIEFGTKGNEIDTKMEDNETEEEKFSSVIIPTTTADEGTVALDQQSMSVTSVAPLDSNKGGVTPPTDNEPNQKLGGVTTLAETGQLAEVPKVGEDDIVEEGMVKEPESKMQEPGSEVKTETKKPLSFKLNPDAMEFKPISDTPPMANTPPPSFQTYGGSRGPRPKGPRGPRPSSSYVDQQGLYGGYQMRQVIHPQVGVAASQIPTHMTTPTSMMMRQPVATPIIGQQGHIYSSLTQSPMGQQMYLPVSQSAAMFGHAHHSLAPALPQSPVVYLQAPIHPQSFVHGFPQLGGGANAGGIMGYTQSQLGKQ